MTDKQFELLLQELSIHQAKLEKIYDRLGWSNYWKAIITILVYLILLIAWAS